MSRCPQNTLDDDLASHGVVADVAPRTAVKDMELRFGLSSFRGSSSAAAADPALEFDHLHSSRGPAGGAATFSFGPASALQVGGGGMRDMDIGSAYRDAGRSGSFRDVDRGTPGRRMADAVASGQC